MLMTEPPQITHEDTDKALEFYRDFVAMITASKTGANSEALACALNLTATPSLAFTTVNLLVNLLITVVPGELLDAALAIMGSVGATLTHEEILETLGLTPDGE